MKNDRKKLIKIIEVLLVAFVDIDREVTKLMETLEENEALIKIYVSSNKEILPINELIKVLKIKEDSRRDELADRLLEISEENINAESSVKKFMEDYIL